MTHIEIQYFSLILYNIDGYMFGVNIFDDVISRHATSSLLMSICVLDSIDIH